jgi:CRISPR-associated protein Cas2
MVVLAVSKVTTGLRRTLSRWMIEVQAGVFVGQLPSTVRDRLWALVQGRKRLGSCVLVARAANEQGFTISACGESRRTLHDYDGLTLTAWSPKKRSREGHKPARCAAVNPTAEGCGGDPSAGGPGEAATLDREVRHPERTVLPE